MTGGTLREIVLGPAGPEQAARLQFYVDVTGAALADSGQGPEAVALAQLVMEAFGSVPAAVLRRRLASLRVVAASRARAASAVAPVLRRGEGPVEVLGRRYPHAGFFALEELELTHLRFDGGRSPRLRREVFVAGDAVTVLPYDPVRDRVLLIEQFRMGPFGRGDPHPWQLEAIAGRIDPGETPEEAARREAIEEAGLVLGALEKVAEYYPTPGAVTEYLYSYVALCDLPDGVAGVFGAAEEAEDIRRQLVGFDRLIEVAAAGEIGNAPLLLTVLWLQRERDRLRG